MNKSIDFQALLNMARVVENDPNIHMLSWKKTTPCGTSNCMVGSFCTAYPNDELKLGQQVSTHNERDYAPFLTHGRYDFFNTPFSPIQDIATRFGITAREVRFLFVNSHTREPKVAAAMMLSKDQALARLRKFIYYKMHKAEMTLEEGRRVSGNLATMRAANKALAFACNET